MTGTMRTASRAGAPENGSPPGNSRLLLLCTTFPENCAPRSDLKPTPKVIDLHKRHIDDLLQCGVEGFRFDAAKHIRPETLRTYVEHIKRGSPNAFVYFEVLSGNMDMQSISTPTAATTDFPYCYALRAVVRGESPMSTLRNLPTVSCDSVRFVRNHDTIMNHDFARSHGYKHDDPCCAIAWVFMLTSGGGSALVFPEDEDMGIGQAKPVRAALKFRRQMIDRGNPPVKVQPPEKSATPSARRLDELMRCQMISWLGH
jgi:hypothetical protein